MNYNNICEICFDKFDNHTIILNCNHKFHITCFKYSIENKIVTTHSAIFKYSLYMLFIDSILSSETKKTLNNIVISSNTSKSFPAGVSASYMIV